MEVEDKKGFFKCKTQQTIERPQEYEINSLEATKGVRGVRVDIGNVYQAKNELQKQFDQSQTEMDKNL